MFPGQAVQGVIVQADTLTARVGLAQTNGLGGNATAAILKR